MRSELRNALGEKRFDYWFERGENDYLEAVGRGESIPECIGNDKYVDAEQLRDVILLYSNRDEQEPNFDSSVREMFLAFAFFYKVARLEVGSLETLPRTQVSDVSAYGSK